MKFDLSRHNPGPQYIRDLIGRAGLNQTTAAAALGVTSRTVRNWVSVGQGHKPAPYVYQFALESIAEEFDQ